MRLLPVKYAWPVLGALVVWAGLLRFWNLGRRPFWCDEAWVAMTVRDRPYGELLRQTDVPLPPLFAVAAKLAGRACDSREVACRFWPALLGTLLVPATYAAVRALRMPRSFALAAAGLCASDMMLLAAARQAKQYGPEAFLGVLAALLAFAARSSAGGRRRAAAGGGLVALAALGPWLGYGAVFPLGALTLLLVLLRPQRGRRRTCLTFGLAGLAALALSLAVLSGLSAGAQARNPALVAYARSYYVEPLKLASWGRAIGHALPASANVFLPLEWFAALNQRSRNLLIWLAALALWLCALLGLRSWPRRTRREMAWWVCGPPLAMLAAALAQRYPFGLARMVAFWAPPLVIAAAAGLVTLGRAVCLLLFRTGGPALVLSILLGALPAAYVIRVPLAQRYMPYHDIPRLLRLLDRNRRPAEPVIVDVTAVPSVRYYRPGLAPPVIYAPVTAGVVPVGGPGNLSWMAEALRRAGARCWLLTTSAQSWGRHERLIALIRARGYELELFARGGTADRAAWSADLLLATRRPRR